MPGGARNAAVTTHAMMTTACGMPNRLLAEAVSGLNDAGSRPSTFAVPVLLPGDADVMATALAAAEDFRPMHPSLIYRVPSGDQKIAGRCYVLQPVWSPLRPARVGALDARGPAASRIPAPTAQMTAAPNIGSATFQSSACDRQHAMGAGRQ